MYSLQIFALFSHEYAWSVSRILLAGGNSHCKRRQAKDHAWHVAPMETWARNQPANSNWALGQSANRHSRFSSHPSTQMTFSRDRLFLRHTHRSWLSAARHSWRPPSQCVRRIKYRAWRRALKRRKFMTKWSRFFRRSGLSWILLEHEALSTFTNLWAWILPRWIRDGGRL